MKCSQCGGEIVNIKPCKLQLDPYYDDERDCQDGFEGECKDCKYEEVWSDI